MTAIGVYFNNLFHTGAALIFVIGVLTLLLHNNLIKKIVGLGIMDSAIYLMLTGTGYVYGRAGSVVEDAAAPVSSLFYGNPVPTGLVLTGILVSVSVTAILLALTVRLYKIYGTLDLDKILAAAKKGDN